MECSVQIYQSSSKIYTIDFYLRIAKWAQMFIIFLLENEYHSYGDLRNN